MRDWSRKPTEGNVRVADVSCSSTKLINLMKTYILCHEYHSFLYAQQYARLQLNLQGSSGGVVVRSWLAEQDILGSIPGLAAMISEIDNLRLPSRDMAKIPLKRCKSSKQPTKLEGIRYPNDQIIPMELAKINKTIIRNAYTTNSESCIK